MITLIFELAVCLALTVLVEGSVAFIVGVRQPTQLSFVCLAQIVTNPVAVLIYSLVCHEIPEFRLDAFLLIEVVLAFAVEAVIYRQTRMFSHPLTLSLLLNVVSATVGICLRF